MGENESTWRAITSGMPIAGCEFNIKLFKILYPAFVRAHLEFASVVWNFMSKLEGILKRAKKMLIEVRDLDYEKRLKELGLKSLKIRRGLNTNL